MCAKAIINAGIDEVVYGQAYDDYGYGLETLRFVGVKVRRYGS
jgi:deoxycytidylate deaminase